MDNCILLPKSILSAPTPSYQDGIDINTELLHRAFGCELIQEAAILLRLPQVIAVTAQNIFHRFLYRKSLQRYDSFSVAMGSLFLSAKVEERPKLLRDIVFIFHHMYQKRKQLKLEAFDIGSFRYSDWKNHLMTMERYLLKELGFNFYNIMEHPHKYLLYYVKILDGDASLAQISWNYLNDSMRSDVTLRYDAQYIACAAIYMAARQTHFALPMSPPWWSLMVEEFKPIESICGIILSLYEMPKLTWLEPIGDIPYLNDEEEIRSVT